MNEYIGSKKVAERLGCSERHAKRLCISGKLVGAIKVGGRWKVPISADARFADTAELAELTESAKLLDIPANKRTEAIRRLGLIKDIEKFTAAFGGTRSEAMNQFALEHKISKRSLQRWLIRYRNEGLLGLVDMRGGGKFIGQIISEEALELFKSMYLTQQQLSVKACWQNICYVNKDKQKGWKIPSLPFMYKFVTNRIPLPVRILHREGMTAYQAKCAPYTEIDPDSIQPGQVWIGDHSQLNCWIRHRGRWVRPWITAWQDMRSRAIIGFYISASPNQTTILLAMKRAIEKYGPPDSVKIDNGKDYDSECWTGTTKARRRALKKGYIDEQMVAGIYAMMDIKVSFAIPYNPKAKRIERWFDTVDCQFTKTVSTYCGKDSARKPDDLNDLLKSEKAIAEAYNLETFAQIVGQYVEAYNNSTHTGRGMDNRSPSQVLASRQSRRVMAEGILDLLLRVWSRELVIGKNGVRFRSLWYGQTDIELLMHQGQKVRVTYDPDDLRKIYIYDSTTLKLLTIAEQNRLVAYGQRISEEDLRIAMRSKSRAIKIARQFCDSQLTANMNLTDLAIMAMEDARKTPVETPSPTLRPVRTPLDGQVREHKRQEVVKAVKKAAGAESVREVLDLDFSLLKPQQKLVDLELFDE